MVRRPKPKVECPWCKKMIAMTTHGFYRHRYPGVGGARCPGTDKYPSDYRGK